MNAHFFQPPPEQRIGGLDAAIQNLRAALTRAGVSVDGSLPTNPAGEHIVHFHGIWQPTHVRQARRCVARKQPFLVSPHGMLEEWAWRHKWWKKWAYFHLVEKRHLGRAGIILATAGPEQARLRRLFPKKRVEMLPLGLTGNARPDYESSRRALGWAPQERVLLFLSRLHVKKGVELLLRALAIQAAPAQTRLVVVGGGEERYVQSLRALASGLNGRLPPIDWVGEVWGEERWKYFQGADLFCLPTYSENFGLAVLEACQVGTPALTTDTTPWAGYLGNERGYICAPEISSVRNQLDRFFAQPRGNSRGARGKLSDWTFQNFHWDVLTPQYLALYRSLL